MAIPTWGMLEKSQTDPEKIEEAIDLIVGEHNDDEEAHLGSGQSLQSHKAAEIIDHVAQSIVEDKLRDYNVTPIKLGTLVFSSFFESLDNYNKSSGCTYSILYRCVLLTTTAVQYNDQFCNFIVVLPLFELSWDKDRFFETRVRLNSNADLEAFIGVGPGIDPGCVWFYFKNGKIYGKCGFGGASSEVELCNYSANVKYGLYFEFFAGDHVDFYVDNVLKGSLDTNLPSGSIDQESIFASWIITLANASKIFQFAMFDFRQKI